MANGSNSNPLENSKAIHAPSPTSLDAQTAFAAHFESQVKDIQRFTTGNHHYVYDVTLCSGEKAVVRMALPEEKETLRSALYWNQQLRPQGIPLPKIWASDLESPFPYMIIERFAGTDLGYVFQSLSNTEQVTLATHITHFQNVVSRKVISKRFGFANHPKKAPYANWPQVLTQQVQRSQDRIQNSGIIDLDTGRHLLDALLKMESIQNQPSVAFLHDLTSKNVIIAPNHTLSGVVDVDDLCFGDPTFHLALTAVALDRHPGSKLYIQTLLNGYKHYNAAHLLPYKAVFFHNFLSEIGLDFNGNPVDAQAERIAYLKESLQACLNAL